MNSLVADFVRLAIVSAAGAAVVTSSVSLLKPDVAIVATTQSQPSTPQSPAPGNAAVPESSPLKVVLLDTDTVRVRSRAGKVIDGETRVVHLIRNEDSRKIYFKCARAILRNASSASVVTLNLKPSCDSADVEPKVYLAPKEVTAITTTLDSTSRIGRGFLDLVFVDSARNEISHRLPRPLTVQSDPADRYFWSGNFIIWFPIVLSFAASLIAYGRKKHIVKATIAGMVAVVATVLVFGNDSKVLVVAIPMLIGVVVAAIVYFQEKRYDEKTKAESDAKALKALREACNQFLTAFQPSDLQERLNNFKGAVNDTPVTNEDLSAPSVPTAPPAWDGASSWASNLGVAGGLVTSLLGLSILPAEPRFLTKSGYVLVSVLFTAITTLAPSVYRFVFGASSESKQRFAIVAIAAAGFMTVSGALGQIGLVIALLYEFSLVGVLGRYAVLPFVVVLIIVAVALFLYAVYSMFEMTTSTDSAAGTSLDHPKLL